MEKSLGFCGFKNFVEAASQQAVQQQQVPGQQSAVLRDTYNTPRQRLDFDTLYGKAFKITYPGNGSDRPGEAGFDRTPEDWSFSIVTPGNGWDWPEKRISIAWARAHDELNGTQGAGPAAGKPNLDDEKYRQIVDTAKRLGLM